MDLPYDKDFYKDYGIFVKPIDYPMSTRKIEALMEISKMQKYFQCNPLKWIDLMYNMEMLDCQALIIQRAWNCPNVLVTASRGLDKSTRRRPTSLTNNTVRFGCQGRLENSPL